MSEITRSRVGVSTYLIPSGPLNDRASNAALRKAIEASLRDADRHLVVDLSGVGVVNSETLEILLDAQDHVSPLGGELRVANENATVKEVLRITEVDARIASIDASGEQAHPRVERLERRRIGEILVGRGYVDKVQLDAALEVQSRTGTRMADVLVGKGQVTETQLLEALSEQLALPFITLRPGLYDPAAAVLIELDRTRRHRVLPLFSVRGTLFLATTEPQSVPVFDEIEDLTGLSVRPVLASSAQILTAIEEAHSSGTDLAEFIGDLDNDLELVETQGDEEFDLLEQGGGSPVVSLINGVIQRAIRDAASDIHIERSRTTCRVRLRVDGVLYTIMTPPVDIHPAIVSRLKVMANLDISERRLPQDGRLQVSTAGRLVDLRFSSLPGIYGEKLVLRVLDKNQAILDVDRLGMSDTNRGLFGRLLGKSYGLLLVTGPTGSGKTTSLYAGLNHLNSSEKNIVTIEDPVEYQIEGINQNQVKEGIGLSFARMLKHVLRQDPDVIMLGEIREKETAEIAVQAALTGHLVLSTLHTNDSVGAVTRMLDMGIEPFLLSSALIGVMAQRLLRAVCPDCATTFIAPDDLLERFGLPTGEKVKLARGRGCASCYDSGYKGRLAIHEIIESTAAFQRVIVHNPARDELVAFLEQQQVATLLDDGMRRARAGLTTLEETFRVVNA